MSKTIDPLLRRRGRIQIPREIIESHPDIVRDFMCDFLVLEASHHWDCMAIEYLVTSANLQSPNRVGK